MSCSEAESEKEKKGREERERKSRKENIQILPSVGLLLLALAPGQGGGHVFSVNAVRSVSRRFGDANRRGVNYAIVAVIVESAV